MGMIIAKIIAWGVPERFARPLAIAGLIVLLLAVMGGVKCAYDRNLIRNHNARVGEATAKADRSADNAAAVQRRVDDARLIQETTELEKVQANAPNDTQRRLARHRCLRLQQDARAKRREPPACV